MPANNENRHFPARESLIESSVIDGRIFRFFHEQTIAAGAKFYIVGTIPPNLFVALSNRYLSVFGSPCKIRTYADPVITVAGTPVNVIKHNLRSNQVGLMSIQQGPTVTVDPAKLLNVDFAPASSSQGSNIGTGSAANDIVMTVLPSDVLFAIEIENMGNDPADIIVKYTWLERLLIPQQ